MADVTAKELLSGNEFFTGLTPSFIDFLARHATHRRIDAGDVLFRYGDASRHFYLVQRGSISVEVAAIEGPSLELQALGPGAVLGWSWMISPYKWSFQARATTPADVLEFDGQAILAHCEQDAKFGYELLKRFSALMSERLNFARQKMMEEWKPQGFA